MTKKVFPLNPIYFHSFKRDSFIFYKLMIEVEIRAKVQDFESIKKRLEEIGGRFLKKEKMADYIFGRAKDLDQEHKIIDGRFSARIRQKNDKISVEFKEIKRAGAGMEFSSPVSSVEAGLNFLKKLDFERAFTVSKIRETYGYQGFEVCLDDVDVLGCFIEIEHPCKEDNDKAEALKECENLLNSIAPNAILEPKKYGDLMQEVINENNEQ